MSQGRCPHGAREPPVALHEDFEPPRGPKQTLGKLLQQPHRSCACPAWLRLQNVGREQPLPNSDAQGGCADPVKMQSLTQQGWGGPESLHLTSSQVMLTILDCGAHFLYSKADGDKSTERPPPSPQWRPLPCSGLGSASTTQRPQDLRSRILFPFVTLGASLVAQLVKNPPAMQETRVQSLGGGGPLEEGMATHSSILAWRIRWAEEPGGLQPWGRKDSEATVTLRVFPGFSEAVRRLCSIPIGSLQKRTEGLERGRE